MAFESLDFVYHPSRDVKRDVAYFTDVLGGRLRFAVEGMGARVAAIELAKPPPLLLLADHVKGSTPILVYRVPNLSRALAKLTKQGWKDEATFEIPHGPICSFRAHREGNGSRSMNSRGRPQARHSRAGATSKEPTRGWS
jgi:hypothetical protein